MSVKIHAQESCDAQKHLLREILVAGSEFWVSRNENYYTDASPYLIQRCSGFWFRISGFGFRVSV